MSRTLFPRRGMWATGPERECVKKKHAAERESKMGFVILSKAVDETILNVGGLSSQPVFQTYAWYLLPFSEQV